MHIKNHSKGQAILFAVVGVTIALAIGVTVASRNLTSSSRVSRTDTTARAYAAAEGGIERLLALSDTTLNNLLSATPACTSAGFSESGVNGYCLVTFPPSIGDTIPSTALVKVENSNTSSSMIIQNGYTKEITLNDGTTQYGANTIRICWKNPQAALAYYSYNTSTAGTVRRGALYPTAEIGDFPHLDDIFTRAFLLGNTQSNGFPYCRDVNIVSTSYGLRITALYEDTEVGVFPTSGSLPRQGYKLTSIGKAGQTGEVSKNVIVYRSNAYLPSFFDSAIYSSNGQID